MSTRRRYRTMLGVFPDATTAGAAYAALREAGFAHDELDVLTDAPYPEGAFGEPPVRHRLYAFPFIGAACGFAVGILITVGTQLAYPLVTGGKPILSIPPMVNVLYEGTMLGAISFTVLGILFESRLPWLRRSVYDPRISLGYVGVQVTAPEDRIGGADQALQAAGAEDIVREAERA